jgi:hypothetical protein
LHASRLPFSSTPWGASPVAESNTAARRGCA